MRKDLLAARLDTAQKEIVENLQKLDKVLKTGQAGAFQTAISVRVRSAEERQMLILEATANALLEMANKVATLDKAKKTAEKTAKELAEATVPPTPPEGE
jgi:hypothetical protein